MVVVNIFVDVIVASEWLVIIVVVVFGVFWNILIVNVLALAFAFVSIKFFITVVWFAGTT